MSSVLYRKHFNEQAVHVFVFPSRTTTWSAFHFNRSSILPCHCTNIAMRLPPCNVSMVCGIQGNWPWQVCIAFHGGPALLEWIPIFFRRSLSCKSGRGRIFLHMVTRLASNMLAHEDRLSCCCGGRHPCLRMTCFFHCGSLHSWH